MIKFFNFLLLFQKFCFEDPLILSKCSNSTKFRFSLIGFIFILFFCYSIFTLVFFSFLITNNLLLSFFISIIPCLIFFNLFILINNTLTKSSFLSSKPLFQNGISLIIRFLFLFFILLILSQIFGLFIFQDSCLAFNEHNKLELIKSFQLLVSKKGNWIFSLISFGVFLMPFLLKNSLSKDSDFYSQKINMDRSLVINEYNKFKELYAVVISKFSSDNLVFSELYSDYPDNTVRIKKQRNLHSKRSFISELYNGGK